jgi:hypothetical protein
MPKRSSREQEILAIWDKYGGMMSLRRLTQLCWEEGVWSQEERHNRAFRSCMRECEAVLQRKDAAGLPIAGPSQRRDGKGRVWVQLTLWDYDTAIYNLAMRLRQSEQDYATIRAIQEYIKLRWGEAPPIPTWEFPEEEPLWWHDGFDDEPEDED